MSTVRSVILALILTLSLAACSTAPPEGELVDRVARVLVERGEIKADAARAVLAELSAVDPAGAR